MGAGKTTLGKLLANNLKLEYIDMDQLIVKLSGRQSDREIFDIDGEEKFRLLETAIAQRLKYQENAVISTGGGVVINDINMQYLKAQGKIIFLKTSFETSQKRISPKNPPPLFRDKKRARMLYDLRLPLYENYADIVIDTDNKKLEEIVDEIISKINI